MRKNVGTAANFSQGRTTVHRRTNTADSGLNIVDIARTTVRKTKFTGRKCFDTATKQTNVEVDRAF